MSRTSQIALAPGGIPLTLLTACSKRDKVVGVADDDPQMAAAISNGRETLPQFWQVFDNRERGESDFALRVMITDKRGAEHFWATDLERRDGKTLGTINNDANAVASVKLGDTIEIPEANITDWLYMRDGKMVGNRALKPLFKQMPAAEVERLKKMMADNDGGPNTALYLTGDRSGCSSSCR